MSAVAQFSPTLAKILELPGVLPFSVLLGILVVFSVIVAIAEQASGRTLGQWLGLG